MKIKTAATTATQLYQWCGCSWKLPLPLCMAVVLGTQSHHYASPVELTWMSYGCFTSCVMCPLQSQADKTLIASYTSMYNLSFFFFSPPTCVLIQCHLMYQCDAPDAMKFHLHSESQNNLYLFVSRKTISLCGGSWLDILCLQV